jgi:tetratricopeptide (TPR) repeat protein
VKRRYFILLLSILVLTTTSIVFAKSTDYQVVDFGNNLQLNTPYGTRVYFGDLGIQEQSSWRIEIPIKDLRTSSDDQNEKEPGEGKNSYSSLEDNSLILSANDLYNQGKFRESLAYVDEMIRRNEKNTRAWIMRGSLYHALGQKDLAKTAWQSAQQSDPTNQEVKKILENYQ